MGLSNTGPEIPESTGTQLRMLWQIILDPHAKRELTRFAGAITVVIALNAVAQIRLNDWQGSIYDAIGQREVPVFLRQVGVFLVIVSVLLCLNVAQTWLHERLKVRLRQAFTYDLVGEWLKPRRAYQLKLKGDISVNPDQRIQDDAKRLSELSVDLGVGLVQSFLLLLAFIGVLWQLSDQVVFSIHGRQVVIPGYMVWAAIAYSALGSSLTWLVGRPLIEAHSELRAKEADFRFALVRVSESADEIALLGGEAEEKAYLHSPIDSLLSTMRHIANRLAGLTWVTGGYGWLAILAPLLLAAPGYFGGTLTLGGLMMVVGGFYQVQTALRWFVDRFPAIAEWRAMLGRVIGYRTALEALPKIPGEIGHETGARAEVRPEKPGEIHYEAGAPAISVENLNVAWNGYLPLRVPNFKMGPGERVLIEATPKSGKSTLHKALAGLWNRGSGTIRMPARESIIFMPQPPYLPMGTLRSALAYPDKADRFSDADVKSALERVGLSRYLPELDKEERWDKELTLEERRRLVIGRVLLHKPKWVVQDESIYELDEESRKAALSIFRDELKDTAVLSIGRRHPEGEFYQRVLKV
ncbi:MAG: ABC transporter ATP-binding protein/permease [Rhodomicrobium sp.]